MSYRFISRSRKGSCELRILEAYGAPYWPSTVGDICSFIHLEIISKVWIKDTCRKLAF